MRDLAERALDTATSSGAGFADVRVVARSSQRVGVKNGAISIVDLSESEGVGIRVLVDGAWGFVGTDRTDGAGIDLAVGRAVRIAKASARVRSTPVVLGSAQSHVGSYATPIDRDPFAVSLDDKVAVLMRADEAIGRVAGVTVRQSVVECIRERRFFANTEGSRLDQTIVECGGGLDAIATGADEVQVRSYPNSFGRQQLCSGWEAVEAMDLPGNGERIGAEAVALLTADPCPSGQMTVILDATQAALQVHESCGHPTELDRVYGSEAAFAGMSFLTPDLLDTFRYGSEHVSITADATAPGGLGTFGWDDEGVAAQRTFLVDQGIFTGYLSSRETAQRLGRDSSGTMRGWGFEHLPLIRMTNVNLEPGESSLDEMIAGTEHGVYLETNRSWSIDDRRLNFQFGTQNGWEIRDGRIVRLVRNPMYRGITPDFWRSCDAVAGVAEWRMYGVVNCGKGQPMQLMHVGHGAAPCRFRNVWVGPA